jgi:hypothetical protein
MKNRVLTPKVVLDNLPEIFFIFAVFVIAFGYGTAVGRYEIFPYTLIEQANDGRKWVLSQITGDFWGFVSTDFTTTIPTYEQQAAYNGLSAIASFTENAKLSVRIIDMKGELVHGWDIDWFEIWPDATHLPESARPKRRPGTHIHGMVLLDNGDLIFNFDELGLVKLDVCGNVVWRLPYRTHHSIYQDEYGDLWVSGNRYHTTPLPGYPTYKPPFIEPMVYKISVDGEVLSEISILDLLKENNLEGLLYIEGIHNDPTEDYWRYDAY